MSKLKLSLFVLLAASALAGTRVSAQLKNPSPADTAKYANNPCSDGWVSIAIMGTEINGVAGVAGHGDQDQCAKEQYNGGHWNSFDELVRYVRESQATLRSQNVEWAIRGGQPALAAIDPSKLIAGIDPKNLLSPNGGNVIAAGGGNVIAAGGGNLVSGAYSLNAASDRVKIAVGGGRYIVIRK